MKINEETKVRKQDEISLITTIPKTYVKALNIKSGDKLEWILDTRTETLKLKVIKWLFTYINSWKLNHKHQ